MKKYIDKKLFYILLGYVLLYHIYLISRGIVLKLNNLGVYGRLNWKETIIDPLVTNLLIIPPVIILIILITKLTFDRHYKWKYVILIHFVLSMLYIITMYIFLYAYQIITNQKTLDSINIKDFFIEAVASSNLHFLGYVGFVSIIYCYYYINKIVKIELQKVQLTQQVTNARLEMLKAQLDPHFLFNTLHSISSLISLDPGKAQNMISYLGDLLREIIVIKHEDTIPLSRELVILEKYMEIMLIRFSDHLSIKIDIEDDVKNALIPSLMVQPIIENSIKHGYSAEHTDLEIKINIYKKKNNLVLEIENNGKILDKNKKRNEGIGIKNSIERLKTLYNTDYSFTFKTLKSKKGVITIIKIPLQY
ncbi:sensor histidine kinase [Xanthomarina spongicola]|uniref:Signal transduction histidine kinase internal region domain-containing protein n=1 Tax=Xanthomarina spongicola TaxID=570520 RepID=A0A316DSW7_9FLAO|nr:histidine kinase [Xanthomarina spongicola]PWK19693.1 hypothetical protein LX78_01043 [Xanthomarina spongicola]